MQIVSFNGDGTATVEEQGRAYTLALASLAFSRQADGSAFALSLLTPNMTAADGTVSQACFPLLGDRDARRLFVRYHLAKGDAATLAAAAALVAAAIQAQGGAASASDLAT